MSLTTCVKPLDPCREPTSRPSGTTFPCTDVPTFSPGKLLLIEPQQAFTAKARGPTMWQYNTHMCTADPLENEGLEHYIRASCHGTVNAVHTSGLYVLSSTTMEQYNCLKQYNHGAVHTSPLSPRTYAVQQWSSAAPPYCHGMSSAVQ
jgi:hypothetical protein